MPAVSEEELQATGLGERFLNTYRLAGATSLPKAKLEKLAKKLKLAPDTVKTHLARVRRCLEAPESLPPVTPKAAHLEGQRPDTHAKAVVALATPGASAAAVARELGIGKDTALRIGKELDAVHLPLRREIADVRLEDLMHRFGTLSRDAMDAITPEKLAAANAKDLAIMAGIGFQNWQLARGQPTSRTEIGDRRQMNELVAMMVKEAKHRGVEIDVTPEGGVAVSGSKHPPGVRKRVLNKITSGDPPETRSPA